nr:MAG TPA: Ferric reductase NAD binding domain [Caudoviricetes sp.]
MFLKPFSGYNSTVPKTKGAVCVCGPPETGG